MASFARTWLGDGRTPKHPSQDIGAPFSHCYPLINYPQVPGGCPLITHSLALSLLLYLKLSLSLSLVSLFFSPSSDLAYSQLFQSRFSELSLPIVWMEQPVDARYLLVCGHCHVVSKVQIAGSAPSSNNSRRIVRRSEWFDIFLYI